jgi:hypothetical protein
MVPEGAKRSAKAPSATIPTLAVQSLPIAVAYIESEDRSEKILLKADLTDASNCDVVLTGISILDPDLDWHRGTCLPERYLVGSSSWSKLDSMLERLETGDPHSRATAETERVRVRRTSGQSA